MTGVQTCALPIWIPAGEKISYLEFRHPRGPFLERLLGGWVREYASRMLAVPEWDGAQARVDEWVEDMAD